MKRYAAPIILILFLAIGLAIFVIFRRETQNTAPAETAAPVMSATETTPSPVNITPTPTATPIPTMPPTPTPTPIPTMPPRPTPTPTPAPTAEPTPTPVIVRETTGSFRTETGKWLNMIVKYIVKRNGDQATLYVDAYAESYSLETAKRLNDLCIVIDGVQTYVGTGPILVTENSILSETLLGSAQASVRPGSNVRVDVTWNFNGTYGGEEISQLSAVSTIAIP